jgi:hypothetical protein
MSDQGVSPAHDFTQQVNDLTLSLMAKVTYDLAFSMENYKKKI